MDNITRRRFISGSASVAAAATLPAFAQAKTARPPNVLFLGCDDQNTRLGCYGDHLARTPNLDALATRGTRFASAYCQYPLCGPSRASLMTGLAPDTTGVHDLETFFRTRIPNAVTIAQLFQRNGYFSARVGKIFHQDVPLDIGTSGQDDPASWQEVRNPIGKDRTEEEVKATNFTPGKVRHRADGQLGIGSSICFEKSSLPDTAMTDSIGADETIQLLEAHGSEPFFLAYGMYRPHVPWIVPSRYFDLFPLESIKLAPRPEGDGHVAPEAAYTTHPDDFGMTPAQRIQAIQAYYASSAFMDAQVGRVLSALKRLHLEQNTIVVYWADHGWSLGEHGQWQKQNLFESATHVPLIFAGPGIKRGISRETVEHLDIYPTLADLCGLKDRPGMLHGNSLLPQLRGATGTRIRPAVTQVQRGDRTFGYTLRDGNLRYTVWRGDGPGEELYDYATDPYESVNLASSHAYADRKQQLREQLDRICANRRG